MRTADIMTRSPSVITPATRINEAARLMRDRHTGFLPVVSSAEQQTLVGVVTDRDIVVRALAAGFSGDVIVAQVMSAGPLHTAHPDDDIHTVITDMERHQVRRIPVVDDAGRVVGIVSQADIAIHVGPLEPVLVDELLTRLSAPPLTEALPNGRAMSMHSGSLLA